MRRSPLRPSATDKLDDEFGGCNWFASNPNGETKYLNRGQDLDTAYRDVIAREAGQPIPESYLKLSDEDKSRVMWAVGETIELANGSYIFTNKDNCKVVIPGFHNPGEVDAECSGELFSTDIKSGQEYRYYNQQACYAYGMMLKHFATEWSVWMLYMDLKKRVPYHYTLEGAQATVERLVASYDAPGEPRVGQFCSWCANFTECPAQRQLVDRAMGHIQPTFNFAVLQDDPVKLGQFLELLQPICKDKGFFDMAKTLAKENMLKKIEVPGWKLQSRSGNRFVNVEDIIGTIPIDDLLKKTISAEDYDELCAKHGVESQSHLIKQAGDSIFATQIRGKK